ncbi:hypothetical protein O7623_00695 [Solwaraspora sp. WMMD791]|uniref:hypothetical protein n=1 Tax=Solwaraspora sp. WMMD791 TaxID=3016086 RepID=UPI00249CDC1C|nr:hypothetical protein [Solwaraspora sp. WMMD791]WFE27769.1 hypothetical protein O7623_00695 [Solwaraspora sp. WMMD791]
MSTAVVEPPRTGPDTGGDGAPYGPFGPVLGTGGADPTTVIPVSRGGRPLGVFVVTAGRVRYRPVVAADRIAATVLAATVLTAVSAGVAAVAASRRRPPTVRSITMGPGGWVSLKGLPGAGPRVVADGHRPWWARMLRARRLSG